MINIRNTQRKIKLPVAKIKTDFDHILKILKYSDFDIGIWFTNNKTIREYNYNFRQKDKPTDILSFPYHQHLKAGERIKAKSREDKNLGDIIISPEYVLIDAEKQQENFYDRLRMLFVHGVCHLLGYDHINDADFRIMHAKESAILKQLSK